MDEILRPQGGEGSRCLPAGDRDAQRRGEHPANRELPPAGDRGDHDPAAVTFDIFNRYFDMIGSFVIRLIDRKGSFRS